MELCGDFGHGVSTLECSGFWFFLIFLFSGFHGRNLNIILFFPSNCSPSCEGAAAIDSGGEVRSVEFAHWLHHRLDLQNCWSWSCVREKATLRDWVGVDCHRSCESVVDTFRSWGCWLD